MQSYSFIQNRSSSEISFIFWNIPIFVGGAGLWGGPPLEVVVIVVVVVVLVEGTIHFFAAQIFILLYKCAWKYM